MINETNAAYLCPECENINIFKINIFSFSGNRKKVCTCACGNSSVNFKKNANKSVTAELICPICNEEHSFNIPNNQFWTSESFSFPCTYYEATSLIIGKGEKLEASLKSYIENEINPISHGYSSGENLLVDKLKKFSDDVYTNTDQYRFCDCDSTYSCAYNESSVYIICDNCNISKKLSYEEIFSME